MAMSPRLLRPKAAGNTAPQFTTQGYARVWGVTTKSSGNVTGTAESDTGYYAVKWWDNTTTVYDSGDPFSKTAAGNQRAFEVYPCDAGGVASGQFDGFDISNNALTRVRPEGVTLADGVAGGFVPTGSPTYYGFQPYTYVPGSPTESAILSGNLLSASALDEFYTDLDAGGGDIFVSGNPGIVSDTPTIATAKGYTVFGSVPPGTALLLNFNGSNGSTAFTDSSPNGLTVNANGGVAISTAQSKFGGASGYFDGGTDRLTIPDASGFTIDGDFTVEAWVRPTEWNTGYDGNYFISQSNNLGNNANRSWGVFVYDGSAGFYYTTDGETDISNSFSATVALNEWTHIAASISGNTLRVFINGNQVGTNSVSLPVFDSTADLCVGTFGKYAEDGYSGLSFTGYIDDLRIVKGAALYTANFTPPAAQLGVYP